MGSKTIIKGINEVKLDVTIIGKKKPQLRTFESGFCFVKFFVKHEKVTGQKVRNAFLSIALDGKIAKEFVDNNIWATGRRMYIEGSLTSWMTKDKTKSGVDVKAEFYHAFPYDEMKSLYEQEQEKKKKELKDDDELPL